MAELRWEPGFKAKYNVPRIDPEEMQQAMETPKVYVWNVSPREFVEHRGSLGRFVIPACKPGEEVSEPLVLNGWLFETAVDTVDGSDITYKQLRTSGRKLAADIIGIGPGKDASQRYDRFGVFISEGTYPTPEELEAANARLHAFYSELVRRADEAYELNGGTEIDDRGIPKPAITKDHIEAGKALNLDRPWLRKQGKMMECENCGKSNVPTASRCVQCSAVFDEEKDRRLFPRDYQAVSRGPGRPPKEVAA